MHFGKFTTELSFNPRGEDVMGYRKIDRTYHVEKYMKISELIRENHFWSVWNKRDREKLFEITNKIIDQFNDWVCERENVPNTVWKRGEVWQGYTDKIMQPLNYDQFDYRWQHTCPFHKEYMKARDEFWRLIMADF